ncbi:MAG TPA: TetR/AcrR family transcriptional regulator [Amycolatopsis sp.]|nr:TetR/AcrR family transcriptional regulator [Amycolatopsis sp.]
MANVPTARRRAMLVDAAVQVIGEAGVGAATTRRIADRAGAPLATVHYCFRHKEDLYLEVFRKLSEEFARAAAEVQGTDLAAVAAGYLRATVGWMLENEVYASAQLDLFVWLLRNNDDVAEYAYQPFMDRLVPLLAAVCPGDGSAVVENVARAVLVMLDGITLQWFASRDKAATAAQLDLLCAVVPEVVRQARSRNG